MQTRTTSHIRNLFACFDDFNPAAHSKALQNFAVTGCNITLNCPFPKHSTMGVTVNQTNQFNQLWKNKTNKQKKKHLLF